MKTDVKPSCFCRMAFVLPAGNIPETDTVTRTVHLCSQPFTSHIARDVSDGLMPKLEYGVRHNRLTVKRSNQIPQNLE